MYIVRAKVGHIQTSKNILISNYGLPYNNNICCRIIENKSKFEN